MGEPHGEPCSGSHSMPHACTGPGNTTPRAPGTPLEFRASSAGARNLPVRSSRGRKMRVSARASRDAVLTPTAEAGAADRGSLESTRGSRAPRRGDDPVRAGGAGEPACPWQGSGYCYAERPASGAAILVLGCFEQALDLALGALFRLGERV